MTFEPKPAYIFKICLLGAAAVGKTCLCKRLVFNTFDANTKLTIGIDFYTYNLPIILTKGGEKSFVRLSVWDFGGQEQFKKLFHYYINGVNGIFMVFEMTNLQSLVNLDWWYERLDELNFDNVPKIILGTKQDLVDKMNSKTKVNDLVVQQFLNKHDENDFFKTSSKENTNILNSFKRMTAKILDDHNLPYEKLI
jgi:small GTP-binding protein